MIGGWCTMRLSSRAAGRRLLSASFSRELSTSALSTKQEMEGFTVRDQRPARPRIAKEKRKEYLAQRRASFEAEQEKAAGLGLDWSIKSAVLLERLPVIIEDYSDWQRDFWDVQTQKAQFGKQFPSEMGFKYENEKPLTMEEILEQSPIPLAPRRTPADESNDHTTLDRALDDRLVLIIKPTSEAAWRLPETAWEAGETIRQAAERTAETMLVKMATRKGQRDDVAQLHFVGNCPAGWFWRTANDAVRAQTGTFGDKVFVNRVQLIAGLPTFVESEAVEHLWVTKNEIGEYLGDAMGTYLKHVI
ncbi:unnamed protein product [Laminaria digitata]